MHARAGVQGRGPGVAYTKNLNINQPSRKLTKRQIGPYTITHIVSPNMVVLKGNEEVKQNVGKTNTNEGRNKNLHNNNKDKWPRSDSAT